MKTKLAKTNGGFTGIWQIILFLISIGMVAKAMELIRLYFHFLKPK